MASHISSLIESLAHESLTPDEVGALIDELDTQPINTEGISKNDLTILINLVTDPYSGFKSNYRYKVVKSFLYPRDPIPSYVVVNICGSLGVKTKENTDKRLSNMLQVMLVKWLVSVYSFLEEPDIVERLYGILFNYLEFEYLRPHIAHLLFLSTKKKHVSRGRVERLRGLRFKYDESDHLIALLILYKDFAPDMIFDVFPNISHTIFSQINYTFLNELIALRRNDGKRVLQATNDELKHVELFGQKLKRRKKITLRTDISMTQASQEHINSISSLSTAIENLKIPPDPTSILGDTSGLSIFIQVFLSKKRDTDKLNTWLELILEDFGELNDLERVDLLQAIKNYVDISCYLPDTVVTTFLESKAILKQPVKVEAFVWAFLRILDPSDFNRLPGLMNMLLNEHKLESLDWIVCLLDSLSDLLSSWPKRFQKEFTPINEEEFYSTMLNTLAKLKVVLQKWLVRFNYNISLVFKTLKLIWVIRYIPEGHMKIEDVVLPPNLTYMLLLLNHPYVTSEVCGYLSYAKYFLQKAATNENTVRLTAIFNSYIVDICNAVWRNKAFDMSKKSDGTSFGLKIEFINSLSIKVPIFDRNSTFPSLFNIDHSPAFASNSAKILRSLEDADPECSTRHAGPLTQGSINELSLDPDAKWLKLGYEDTKIEVLKRLDKTGYTGLADLLFSHLKSLLNKR